VHSYSGGAFIKLRAQASDRGPLGTFLRAGEQRGPSKLGNQVMPEPLRAFRWQLCVRAISGPVDGLPEEGFTPRLVDSYWTKGAAIMVCQDEETRDWLLGYPPW